jgi:hypothetical protein
MCKFKLVLFDRAAILKLYSSYSLGRGLGAGYRGASS